MRLFDLRHVSQIGGHPQSSDGARADEVLDNGPAIAHHRCDCRCPALFVLAVHRAHRTARGPPPPPGGRSEPPSAGASGLAVPCVNSAPRAMSICTLAKSPALGRAVQVGRRIAVFLLAPAGQEQGRRDPQAEPSTSRHSPPLLTIITPCPAHSEHLPLPPRPSPSAVGRSPYAPAGPPHPAACDPGCS